MRGNPKKIVWKIKIDPNAENRICVHESFWESPITAKELAELSGSDCRWPVANDLFCGAPRGEKSYCARHYGISIVKNIKKA